MENGWRRERFPPALRSFGKFPQTKSWWPGDLILTRDLKPDKVSATITVAQTRGGFDGTDAIWTHAAVYLGDGRNVCEATFDSLWAGGSVRVTPIWDYCGKYGLRIRRSKYVEQSGRDVGWKLALYALTHLRKQYDFTYIFKLARQAWGGRGFWQEDVKIRIRPTALVCSTLYADAHGRVTRQLLGDSNGLCVPAFLSQSSDMRNVEADWLTVARSGTDSALSAELNPEVDVAVGVVQRNKEIILVRRKDAENTVSWQFPAGIINPKRTAAETVVREVKAETGIHCRVVRELGRRKHPDTGKTLIYFHCEHIEGELKNGDPEENAEVKWIGVARVPELITSDMFVEVTKLLGEING